MDVFTIGNVSARSGSKASGSLKVGELHDGSIVGIHFVIIKGVNDGPTLLVTAGISGTGISSIEAARRVLLKTDPKNLSGTLVVIPIVNEPAFLMGQRSNVLENYEAPIDLFGVFPGSATGPLTGRIADVFTKEVIFRVQYYVDLHNAVKGGRYEPFVSIYPGLVSENIRERAVEIARSFGTRFISDAGIRGPPSPKLAGRPAVVAGSKGIISFMSQCGEDGKLDEVDVEHQVQGVTNVMKFLRMIEGQPEIPREQLISTETIQVKSGKGGFLRPTVHLGDKVSKGQVMAEITNSFCELIERVEAPEDGYVTRMTTTLTVCSGDRIGHLSIV
jgi:predicted deacylase